MAAPKRGKMPPVTNAQFRGINGNAFDVELDTIAERPPLTDEIVHKALLRFKAKLESGKTEAEAMHAVLAPYHEQIEAKAWVVVKDATIGMTGGAYRFSRGQRIEDRSLAIQLKQAGVDIRPAA